MVDDEGDCVGGATVIPFSHACGATSDTSAAFVSEHGATQTVDGLFTLHDLPAGTETLRITHPDYAAATLEGIPVRSGETTSGVEVTLFAGGTIEGVVYDDKGVPLPEVVLHLQSGQGYAFSAEEVTSQLGTVITDSNGCYRLSHLPEQLCYLKRADEFDGLGVLRRTVTPVNRTVTHLDFGGEPIVSGTVLLRGAPLANARLLLAAPRVPFFGAFRCCTVTDEDGVFVFPGVVRGTHALHRQSPDEKNDWIEIATVTVDQADIDAGVIESEAAPLRLTLGRSDWLISNLSLCEGAEPFSLPRYSGINISDTVQPWRFANVEPGLYTVLALRADGVQWRTPITLETSQNGWDLSLDVPESTARFSCHVAGSSGETLMIWRQEKDVFWSTDARHGR